MRPSSLSIKFVFGALLLGTSILGSHNAGAWAPSGSSNIIAEPDCRDEVLSRRVLSHLSRNTHGEKWARQEWGQIESMIQSYMNRCAPQLYKGAFSNIIDYLEMSTIHYDYKLHREIREVSFNFPGDGYVTRGILALKKSKQPRPLVIFKCGLSCDFGNTSMLYTLMVFFDMGPFNVLMIPSNSSASFIKENKLFAIGGLSEGVQLTKIAQHIRSGDWEFSDRVSRIHLFGMSLGGHAALYGSLYADYVDEDANLFTSVLVGCPVVDFKSSLDHVTSDTWLGKLIRRNTLDNTTQILNFVPWFKPYFARDPRFKPKPHELREMVVGGAFNYYKGRTLRNGWSNAPLQDIRFNAESNFWKWMDYSGAPLPLMKTPVYSWAPENDDVVLYKGNSRKLYESDLRLGERRVYKLATAKGGHCAFPAVFGWATTATILNSFFIARSPELLREMEHKIIPLSPKFASRLRVAAHSTRTRITWEAHAKKDYVTLTHQFRDTTCQASPKNPRPCGADRHLRLRLEELHIANEHIPQNDAEAEALTRTLNARIRFVDANGRPLGSTSTPAAFSFIHYGRLEDLN